MIAVSIILYIMYRIGRSFYDTAKKYKKAKWAFAILGIASYFIGTTGAQVIYYLFLGYVSIESLVLTVDSSINLVMMPIGVGISVLLHYLLEQSWKKKIDIYHIDEIGISPSSNIFEEQ